MPETESQAVLVVNAGSSSLKYQLVNPDSGDVLATGLVEKIGEAEGSAKHTAGGVPHTRQFPCPTHREAFDAVLLAFTDHGPDLASVDLTAVGHRVVHGGATFWRPTLVTEEVLDTVRSLIPLAPLHNPANIQGIEVARETFPIVPQVAVFDTAFHQTIPEHAYTYAVPRAWRDDHAVRRYGFHGTSHSYVSRRAAELLGTKPAKTNCIVLHLGNGASACAVRGGESVDTSMGLTPLEGLVMGTRPGDIDPGLFGHAVRELGLSPDEVDRVLSKQSGLLGLTGVNDFRTVMEWYDEGDEAAVLAVAVVAYRIRKYVGAYAAVLGRLDAVVFTGGIGEHNPTLRSLVLDGMELFGIEVDRQANASGPGERRISTEGSAVAAYVIPTNEELEIARQCVELLASSPVE